MVVREVAAEAFDRLRHPCVEPAQHVEPRRRIGAQAGALREVVDDLSPQVATECREQAIEGVTLATEFMLNALRLKQGFTLREFETSTRLPVSVVATPLEKAVDRGWLDRTGERVEPTDTGFRFLNDLQILFTDLEEEVDAHA